MQLKHILVRNNWLFVLDHLQNLLPKKLKIFFDIRATSASYKRNQTKYFNY